MAAWCFTGAWSYGCKGYRIHFLPPLAFAAEARGCRDSIQRGGRRKEIAAEVATGQELIED